MATYVIGDIHGRMDLLGELVDLQLPLEPRDLLVFIGDYVDRGPESCDVIEYLISLSQRRNCIFLRGNHEDMFMAWLGLEAPVKRVSSSHWLKAHGGMDTLKSYGLSTEGFFARWRFRHPQNPSEWFPETHARFLKSTQFLHEDEDAYYVHAGFRAEVPVAEQKPEDELWIRQGWIDGKHEFDKVVIHGHTPTPYDGGELKIRILPHRINVDTGCGRHPNGFLSAMRVKDRAVFSAGDSRQSSY